MTAFSIQLLAAVVQALPRLFLLGAPFLAIAATLAAIVDAKIPGNVKRDLPG